MRAITVSLLVGLLASSCSGGAARDEGQPAAKAAADEQFSAACDRVLRRDIPALEARYRMTIRRGVARIDRSTWERMDRIQRAGLHWPLAYSASCPLGRPGTHRVRMVDENGRELAFQMISTELECRGDHAIIRPEDVEALC